MKIGLIARADNSGLGMQTLEFFRHMKPYRTIVVDISEYNKNKTYPERYAGGPDQQVFHVKGFLQDEDIRLFLDGLDVVFIAEASYNPMFYAIAHTMGVKVAVQYNYEFFDWFDRNKIDCPDMFIAPSRWHYEDVDKFCINKGIAHVYLHCPVNRDLLPPRSIERAQVFLHPAGKPASHDRNGTRTVIEASRYVKSNVEIVVHFQGEQGLQHQTTHTTEDYITYAEEHGNMDKLIISVQEYENYIDVYAEGDVLLLPRRYGGNCLPLNEALAVGMPVIMPDIQPNNHILPPEWLVPATTRETFTPRTTVDLYDVDPVVLARKIDEFASLSDEDMNMYSELASAISDQISWETMKPMYLKAFEELCQI